MPVHLTEEQLERIRKNRELAFARREAFRKRMQLEESQNRKIKMVISNLVALFLDGKACLICIALGLILFRTAVDPVIPSFPLNVGKNGLFITV